MFIGKVTGRVTTTQREPGMAESKLLVIEAYTGDAAAPATLKPTGRVLVAVDTLGAGAGDYVLITQGSSARLTAATRTMPVDAVVIGIIDSVHAGDQAWSVAGERSAGKSGKRGG